MSWLDSPAPPGSLGPFAPRDSSLPERLRAFVWNLVYRIPFAPRLHIFLHDLWAEREWWPIVLPVLLIVGVRTYRRERRKLKP